jgi:hypothetical protein
MTRTGHLRASDADRDQVAERLRTAAAEGRIATDELEQRLEATLNARTYAQLEAVVADLPRPQPVARRHLGLPGGPVARVAVALAVAVPVMMAMIFVVTGVVAGWTLWALAAWWFFGHRRHPARHRHDGRHRGHEHRAHPHHGYGPSRHAHRQAGPGPWRGFWA